MDLIDLVLKNKKKLQIDTLDINPINNGKMYRAKVVGIDGIQVTYMGKSMERLINDISQTYDIPKTWVLVKPED